jgi:carotenoid cleavage dioxygenase-like enzyme
VARSFGRGANVGEAVFVPRAAGADESDGWLLLLAYSSDTDTSALYILHADDVTAEPQAVVHLPRRVPAGFHGNWVPDLD